MKRVKDALLQPTEPMSLRLPQPQCQPTARHNGTSSPTDIAVGRPGCSCNVVKQRWNLKDTRETAQALTAQPPSSPFRSYTCEHGPQTLPNKRIYVLLLLQAPSPARISRTRVSRPTTSQSSPGRSTSAFALPGNSARRPLARLRSAQMIILTSFQAPPCLGVSILAAPPLRTQTQHPQRSRGHERFRHQDLPALLHSPRLALSGPHPRPRSLNGHARGKSNMVQREGATLLSTQLRTSPGTPLPLTLTVALTLTLTHPATHQTRHFGLASLRP